MGTITKNVKGKVLIKKGIAIKNEINNKIRGAFLFMLRFCVGMNGISLHLIVHCGKIIP